MLSITILSMPTTPTLSQIQNAIAIAERIQQLEEELAAVMGGTENANRGSAPKETTSTPAKRGPGRPPKNAAAAASSTTQPAKRGRKPFSAETKAKMAAAQRARWAGKSGATVKPAASKPAQAGKRTMSPEVRARLAAAMKARWATAKKKGLPGPNARK
jgi:hypothetical protein